MTNKPRQREQVLGEAARQVACGFCGRRHHHSRVVVLSWAHIRVSAQILEMEGQ